MGLDMGQMPSLPQSVARWHSPKTFPGLVGTTFAPESAAQGTTELPACCAR
jgi:hypothetical protein